MMASNIMNRLLISTVALVLASLTTKTTTFTAAETIVVGGEREWREGICYDNIQNVQVGDTLLFNFAGHDVYKLMSRSHFTSCDFSDALLMAPIGSGPYEYVVTEDDAAGEATLWFACSIGDHCAGGTQKVQVQVEPFFGQSQTDRLPEDIPTSNVRFGLSRTQCDAVHDGTDGATGGDNDAPTMLDSSCTDPVLEDDGKTWYTSCLSPPATLTPGGVINNLFIMQYPYPTDVRVLVGLRTWEFVADVPGMDGVVEPVPINQLYVHHLQGRIVLGQGTEGIRRSQPDAPFPAGHGIVTGQEGDAMTFHIIDLREVDDWLACIECRCNDPEDGTYLDFTNISRAEMDPFGVVVAGGVSCCTNCTDLAGPTVDYRMRYNVSYSYIEEGDVVSDIQMLTADVSPVVGKSIEYDVPNFQTLPDFLQKDGDPTIQHLVRELPFNELFQMEFFGGPYTGPDTIKVFRCVGHLHVAAIGMWLYDSETGETICNGTTTYGTDPDQDKGFLNAVHVDSYQEPIVFPADRLVQLVVDYNATEYHTGVMGMLFMFIDADRQVTPLEAELTIPLCRNDVCDPSLLPSFDVEGFLSALADGSGSGCEDTLSSSPACSFGGLCDCETVINAPESTGCGGIYTNPAGDIVVNSVCAESCGCPTMSTCEDQLSNSPICNFGQICDCEVLVNLPESTGCGGVYSTEMGDVMIDDVCASFCDACPEMVMDEADLVIEAFVEQMEDEFKVNCLYATQQCRDMISNLLTCGLEAIGFETLNPLIRQAILAHATRLATKYSKLGDASLHLGQQVIQVGRQLDLCNDMTMDGDEPTVDNDDGTSTTQGSDDGNNSGSIALCGSSSIALVFLVALFVTYF